MIQRHLIRGGALNCCHILFYTRICILLTVLLPSRSRFFSRHLFCNWYLWLWEVPGWPFCPISSCRIAIAVCVMFHLSPQLSWKAQWRVTACFPWTSLRWLTIPGYLRSLETSWARALDRCRAPGSFWVIPPCPPIHCNLWVID